ncbi:hypothetical protein ACRQ5B_09410 [Pseudarthrobacter sp. L19]|uniref:hypothetical protein n=1 Tax=Pseudarthrobacter sp. L19 TaxID=3423951 RepID=UPI003D7AAC2C
MDWIVAKTSGAQRLVGMDKSTGFNAAGSPDLMSRLLDQLQHFGTSYVLLGLCPLAAAFACFCARRERRLTGLVGLVLGLYGAYSAAFGTFEEQYGYGVIVTSVLVVAVMTSEFMERHPRYRRPVNAFGIALLVVTFLLGIRAESITDNGYATALEWVRSHLPSDARVSVTNSTGELAFSDDPRFGVWPSAPLMYANGVRYMLTQSLPTSQGYGYAQPGMLRWLASNATPVFRTDGPTNGATTIWMINPIALQKAAQEGIGAPAGTYETER